MRKEMIKRYEIVGFNESKRKITEHITKFGGCPIFLHEQQWPISTGWENRKMMFVGQIVIEKGMLGNEKGIIAYIFITHPGSYNDIFFDLDVAEWGGGENKVIIQNFDDLKGAKPYSQEGPTLFNEKDEMCEYVPILEEGFDVDYLTNEEFRKLTNEQQKEYFTLIDKNKIGGHTKLFSKRRLARRGMDFTTSEITAGNNALDISYSYDVYGQLWEERRNGTSVCYAYDKAGNQIRKNDAKGTTLYRFNGKNQLTEAENHDGKNQFTYDRQGGIVEEKNSWVL